MASKTVALRVPQTIEAADKDVQKMGELERKIATINTTLGEDISQLQEDAAEKLQPLEAEKEKLHNGVQAFAEANRDALTDGGRTKTVKLLGGGVLKWRLTPPRLNVTGTAVRIIATLKRRGLSEFVRVKEELDKEALLARPDVVKKIRGLQVEQREELTIKP